MEIGSANSALTTLQSSSRDRLNDNRRAEETPPASAPPAPGTNDNREESGLNIAREVTATEQGEAPLANSNATQGTEDNRTLASGNRASAGSADDTAPQIYDQNGRNQRPPEDAFINITV